MSNFNTEKVEIIFNALRSAHSLISDEYESLQDDDLKLEYDEVLKQIDKALGTLKDD